MPVHLLDVLFLAQYYIYISDISNRYCLQKVLPEVGLTTLQSGCVACAYPGKSCCMLTLCWPLQLWIWYLCVDVHLYGVSQSEVLGWFYNPNTTPKRQRESSGLPARNWAGVALKGGYYTKGIDAAKGQRFLWLAEAKEDDKGSTEWNRNKVGSQISDVITKRLTIIRTKARGNIPVWVEVKYWVDSTTQTQHQKDKEREVVCLRRTGQELHWRGYYTKGIDAAKWQRFLWLAEAKKDN